MKEKLLARLTLLKDWIIQSKNWQLRLIVAITLLPVLVLSFFVHASSGFTAMGLALSTVAVFSPKIRSQIMAAPKAQLIVSGIFFLVSLGMIMLSSPYLVWGMSINQGLYFMAITFLSLSNAAKAAKLALDKAAEKLQKKSGRPVKKKESKKEKARLKKARRLGRK